MSNSPVTVAVPNVLGGDPQRADKLYEELQVLPRTRSYVFDMGQVDFLKPYGVMVLISAARHLSETSRRPVRLANLVQPVHLYLHRMDLFKACADWLNTSDVRDTEWSRDPQTPNLLELTTIASPADVAVVISRVEHIFSRWLKLPNLRNLLKVLSELCANVYQHSGDPYGCVLIQKYESHTQGQAVVCLAVGDLGCGIRGSLAARHRDIGEDPLDYLHAAMRGATSRSSGRGGLGLRLVEEIVESEGGYLWLRSETAAIHSWSPAKRQGLNGLTFMPGTQIAIEFHAPLPA